MRKEFQLFDLALDRIKKPISYYMDFLEDRFTYHVEAIIDVEPDIEAEEYESEEDLYLLEDITYKRENLIGAKMFHKLMKSGDLGDQNLYFVNLQVMGGDSLPEIIFNSKKEAKRFYEFVLKYIFKDEDKSTRDDIQQ